MCCLKLLILIFIPFGFSFSSVILKNHDSTIIKNEKFNPPRIRLSGYDSGNVPYKIIAKTIKFEIDTPFKILSMSIVRCNNFSHLLYFPLTSQYLTDDAKHIFQQVLKVGDCIKLDRINVEDAKGNRFFLKPRTFQIVKD